MNEKGDPKTMKKNDAVVLVRDFGASPDRLFDAWTDVALLSRWFGCGTDMLWRVHSWEVTPGGAIHVSLDFDGTPYEVRGRFVVVDRPHRLQYEWEAGQVVTVSIEATEAGSRLHLEHAGLAADDMKQIVTGGWTEAMQQLLAVMQEQEQLPAVPQTATPEKQDAV